MEDAARARPTHASVPAREAPGPDAALREARDERLFRSIRASLLARVVSTVIPVLVLPLTLRSLRDERWGTWATVSVTIGWFHLLDLGLGASLRNKLGTAFGNGDPAVARRFVSSALAFLGCVALAGAIASAIAVPLVPWRAVFAAGPEVSDAELRGTVTVLLAAAVLQLPLSIVSTVYVAHQETDRIAIWDMFGGLASLVAVAVAVAMRTDLVGLALASLVPPLAVQLLNGVLLFRKRRPELRPRRSEASLASLRDTLALGLRFWVIQLAAVAVYQSDNLVIMQLMGPAKVTEYAVATRLVSAGIALHALVVAPLWPAYTEAHARGDVDWIRARLRTTVRGSLAAGSLFAVGMVVAGPEVIRLWLAPEHLPTRELLAWLGAWLLLYVWQSCFAMLLNGLGSVHLLSRIAVFGAALNVALCVFCGRRWGLTGIAIANVLTLLIGAVQGPVETHLRLREARAPAGFA